MIDLAELDTLLNTDPRDLIPSRNVNARQWLVIDEDRATLADWWYCYWYEIKRNPAWLRGLVADAVIVEIGRRLGVHVELPDRKPAQRRRAA